MTELKKGLGQFIDFLDQELLPFGMEHWYEGFPVDGPPGIRSHTIGKITRKTKRLLFFSWTSKEYQAMADVIAEPDTPIKSGASDALRIRVRDMSVLPVLEILAERFENAGFGLRAELLY